MRIGIMLPTFNMTPEAALEEAQRAADERIDGVFAYDHVWPMGSPERPAIAPFEVLASVAVRHRGLVVGPLVARVGLVADDVLLGQLRALRVVADGRIVAALGTGDRLSREENLAYGIEVAAPEVRRASLLRIATVLHEEGTEVWIGSGAAATRAVASAVGCTLNLWDAAPAAVEEAARTTAASWAGPIPVKDGTVDEVAAAALLDELERAGATWAVFGSPATVGDVARVRRRREQGVTR